MNALATSGIVFACVFGGALLGMILRAVLHERHLSGDSKDVVKLGMGLIATMTALVLGLLVASAKSSFDAQRTGLAQVSGNVIFLDRILAWYEKGAKDDKESRRAQDARETLRTSVADMLKRTWPQESGESAPTGSEAQTEGRYEVVFEKIQALAPKTEGQRALQAQALKVAEDIAQARWTLAAQRGSSIPLPFLTVVVFWLAILFASFSIFATPNATVIFTLLVCALSVSGAIFLILELDRPYGGFIQISSTPVQNALKQLNK
jgi:hypothetical protein